MIQSAKCSLSKVKVICGFIRATSAVQLLGNDENKTQDFLLQTCVRCVRCVRCQAD